jgi:hypothetical protein
VRDPFNLDTGFPPPRNAPLAQDFNDLEPNFAWGVRSTVGYFFGCGAVELSGYYIFENDSSVQTSEIGRLDSFFFNPPLGFEGDNGMWLQDDIVRTRLKTAVGSAEANFRWWWGNAYNVSYTLGVRYLDLYERFSYFTGDDDLTVRDVNGNPDPTRQATYTSTAHNHIVAPQVGLEWNQPICEWLAFSVAAKGAWGVNFVDFDTRLKRGDGFVGFDGRSSDTTFSHLYELGVFADFRLMDNMRLRTGYNLLWAVDVAEAAEQYDYNLANHEGRRNEHGDIFYHGPSVELLLLF